MSRHQKDRSVSNVWSATTTCVALLASLALLGWARVGSADDSVAEATPADRTASESSAGGDDAEPSHHPGSPRAALSAYLDHCRAGRYAEAAAYLDVPPERAAEREALARRLKAVLDRFVWFDMAAVSAAAEGDLADGLAPSLEQLGTIARADGREAHVRMRKVSGTDGRWLFTQRTVGNVDDWYARLELGWLLERLPPSLLAPGPKELLWWQWIALVPSIALALLVGWLLSRLSRWALRRAFARTSTRWDDEMLERIGGPLTLGWAVGALHVIVPFLGLYEPARESVDSALGAALLGGLFWALARSIDIGKRIAGSTEWAKSQPSSRSLLPLAARVLKVVVLAVAVVALLAELGYPVTSLIAGLGIGGLAFALAAQKTVENLFGAFSIGADAPFREGDFVKVEDFVATVEAIGLRSTKFRTLDRTLVTIPNGRLAEMRLESFTARDRIRLACTVGVEYRTTPAQMRQVLEGLTRVLREHPKIWPDAMVVRLKELAASSLDIEIMAWFQTQDWSEFQEIRQEILLGFMTVVEDAGTSFAFPTRTVHLIGEP